MTPQIYTTPGCVPDKKRASLFANSNGEIRRFEKRACERGKSGCAFMGRRRPGIGKTQSLESLESLNARLISAASDSRVQFKVGLKISRRLDCFNSNVSDQSVENPNHTLNSTSQPDSCFP